MLNIKKILSVFALSLMSLGFFVSPVFAQGETWVAYGTVGQEMNETFGVGTSGSSPIKICTTSPNLNLGGGGTLNPSNSFGTGGTVSAGAHAIIVSGTPTVAGTTSWTFTCGEDDPAATNTFTVIVSAPSVDPISVGALITDTTGTVKTVMHNGIPIALVILAGVVGLNFLIRFLRKHTK